MAEHVPDLDMIIEDEFDKFKAEMTDNSKRIREDLNKLNQPS